MVRKLTEKEINQLQTKIQEEQRKTGERLQRKGKERKPVTKVAKAIWIVVGVVLYAISGICVGFFVQFSWFHGPYAKHPYGIIFVVSIASTVVGGLIGSQAPRSHLAKWAIFIPLVPAVFVGWLIAVALVNMGN